MLDQRAQRVAVRRDEDRRTGTEVGHDRVVPPRQHPLEHVLQALGARQQVARQRRVPLVVAPTLCVPRERRIEIGRPLVV